MGTRAKTPKTSETKKVVLDQMLKGDAETPAITHQFAETPRRTALGSGFLQNSQFLRRYLHAAKTMSHR